MEFRATGRRTSTRAAVRLVEPAEDTPRARWIEPDTSGLQDTGSLNVIVVERTSRLSWQYAPLCTYLGIKVRVVRSETQLAMALAASRPVAVIAEVDAGALDGCHILSIIAGSDTDLPVLMLTDEDPLMLGAVDAAVEHLGMQRVLTYSRTPGPQDVVEFLCRAGLQTGNGRLAVKVA